MAVFILVHGIGNSGSIWNKVKGLLETEGHTVYAPTLSPARTSNLENHITEICDLISEKGLYRVMLVGFSYASFVITGVADRIAERIMKLVYVDSAVPQSGKSLYEMAASHNDGLRKLKGWTPDKPYIEPLYYNTTKIKSMDKAYILCTLSEYLNICRPFFNEIVGRPEEENWRYYQLKSDHECMVSHPEELAAILLSEAD